MIIWNEIEDALRSIIEDYEKVNHVISAFQDDRARLIGLNNIGYIQGTALELGSGPGNYSRMISNFNGGPLICLDYLNVMHKTAYDTNRGLNHHYVLGVFEALPFRKSSIGFITAAYAIRDSMDKSRTISEACNTLLPNGKFLLVDIGKPDNKIIRAFMGVYMKYIVPLMGGLITGYGYRNPWSKLYITFKKLPPNNELVSIISQFMKVEKRIEKILGALVIIVGIRTID